MKPATIAGNDGTARNEMKKPVLKKITALLYCSFEIIQNNLTLPGAAPNCDNDVVPAT
jgi:hypothetical protein